MYLLFINITHILVKDQLVIECGEIIKTDLPPSIGVNFLEEIPQLASGYFAIDLRQEALNFL